MQNNNQSRFLRVKKLNFPLGHYAITGSGPLGIRGLREIADIDIIVSKELWNKLAKIHGIIDTGKIKKIQIPNEEIEVLSEASFYHDNLDPTIPSIAERIAKAEIIEALPFESLDHVLYFKRRMGREKDLKDIEMIQKILVKKSLRKSGQLKGQLTMSDDFDASLPEKIMTEFYGKKNIE